jgi:hypothetical protein
VVKHVITWLALAASPHAFAQRVEPVPPAQPVDPEQPTFLVGGRIGLIASLHTSGRVPTGLRSDNPAPYGVLEAGYYISANTAVVVGMTGAARLVSSSASTWFLAPMLGAEWHARSHLVGLTAGVVGARTFGGYTSEIEYGAIIAIRGGADVSAVQLIAEISALRFGEDRDGFRRDGIMFSLSVGIRGQGTR